MAKESQHAGAGGASPKESPGETSVQVLNLSFPRCGTMSMQAALNQLGYKCWHSTTAFGDAAQCQAWIAAQDAKFRSQGELFTRAGWDRIFAPYTAISADPPAFAFAEELIKAYPDAKVILVERNEDAWFRSFDETVMDHLFRWDLNAVADLDPHMIGPIRDMQQHWVRWWWKVSSKSEMQAKARAMYRAHNRLVRHVTPPGRLLEFQMKDGWAPLCEFLDKPVPAGPFPLRNDRAHVKARNRFIAMRGLKIVGWRTLKLVGLICVCIMAWTMARQVSS